MGIRRKKFLAEIEDWCKKRYPSLGGLCKGNSRGYPVHQQTGPWMLVNSECWPSFPHPRNTTPSTNWADPLLPQASLCSKDMARHPLLGISEAIKGVNPPSGTCDCSVAEATASLVTWMHLLLLPCKASQVSWSHLLWMGGKRHLVHGSVSDSSSNLQRDRVVRPLIIRWVLC